MAVANHQWFDKFPKDSPANNKEKEALVLWPYDQKQQHLPGVVAQYMVTGRPIERCGWATAKAEHGCLLTISST